MKKESVQINSDQTRFIESEADNIRLLAPAGCGKTYAMLERCKSLVSKQPKSRILLLAFTKAAASEIKNRIFQDKELSKISNNITTVTLNKWGFDFLKREGVEPNLITKKVDKYKYIRNDLKPIRADFANIDQRYGQIKYNNYSDLVDIMDNLKALNFDYRVDSEKSNYTDELLKSFKQRLSWIKEQGLEPFFVNHVTSKLVEIKLAEKDSFQDLERFIIFWSNSLRETYIRDTLTFTDQKYLALHRLQEKYQGDNIKTSSRYTHVFVDEFQDINPLDLDFIKELVRVNNAQLTLIGDDDQAIYEWRGASPRFILHPEKYFEVPFETYLLSTNYRSPKNIIEKSSRLIEHNSQRVLKSIVPYFSHDAIITVKHHSEIDEYLKELVGILKKCHEEGEPQSVAVLTRNIRQLIPVQILLTSENIPYYAKEDRDIKYSKAFKELVQLLEIRSKKNAARLKANEYGSYFATLTDNVFLYGIKKPAYNKLLKYIAKMRPKSFDDCLDFFQNYGERVIDRKSVEDAREKVTKAVTKLFDAPDVASAIAVLGTHFDALKKNYPKSEDDMYYKEPPFSYLATYAARYGADFDNFIEDLEYAIEKLDETPTGERDLDLELPVHLMTALHAKGREFKHVIIVDGNEGTWPSKFADTEEGVEQERRLFYVAMTRTQKRLTIFTTEGNEPTPPSRFLREADIL